MDISEILKECYEFNDNILVRDNYASANNYCYIYFSSNALYRKNDYNDFVAKIVEQNRYEWLQLSAVNKPKREIFVRDIYLSWYVCGINKEYSSYNALINLLRDMSFGYTIRCVGASSGGFIAAIVAMELEAEICYSFSGQFSLGNHFDHLRTNPYLRAVGDGEYWFEYWKRIDNYKTIIVYVLPTGSAQDVVQYNMISGCNNIITIKINESRHGVPLQNYAIGKFISLNYNECLQLSLKKWRSKRHISICVAGLAEYFIFAFSRIKRKILLVSERLIQIVL